VAVDVEVKPAPGTPAAAPAAVPAPAGAPGIAVPEDQPGRRPPRLEHARYYAREAVARPWVHYVYFHRPLKTALETILGTPPPRLLIDTDRHGCTVGLPYAFTGGDRQKEAVAQAVAAILGDASLKPAWRTSGRRPEVVFTRPYPPPGRVTLATTAYAGKAGMTIRQHVEAAAWHEIVWGVTGHDHVVITSIDTDSPHTGLSMKSGGGKTVTARSLLAQMLYHGALGVVLDYKLFSHNWVLRNENGEYDPLPNCAYAKTPAQIHDMLLWLEAETRRRNKVADAGADIDGHVHADVGPPIFVIIEELNATQRKLARHWKGELGEKGRSPAADASDELLFVGRQVRVFLVAIGQRLSVKALSGAGVGGDARDNIGTYAMYDPGVAAWRITGWEHPLPGAANHVGRLQIVTASSVTETQSTWMTGAEARNLATGGTAAVPRDDMPYVGRRAAVPDVLADDARAIGGPGRGDVLGRRVAPAPAGPPCVTLAEASAAGITGTAAVAAVRKQLQRDSRAPAPVGKHGSAYTYDENDLHEYAITMKWVACS
jgi:hypothetical protein